MLNLQADLWGMTSVVSFCSIGSELTTTTLPTRRRRWSADDEYFFFFLIQFIEMMRTVFFFVCFIRWSFFSVCLIHSIFHFIYTIVASRLWVRRIAKFLWSPENFNLLHDLKLESVRWVSFNWNTYTRNEWNMQMTAIYYEIYFN